MSRERPGLVRRVLELPRVERLVALAKRSSVVPGLARARFVVRELVSSRVVGEYRVRGVPGVVFVRHGTPDVVTLDEVFYSRDYEPPTAVVEALGALSGPVSVLDLGANAGYFGAFVRAWLPDARVTAFEPDPGNAEIVERTIVANGLTWELIEACAAPNNGTVAFAAGRYSLSRVVDDDSEPGVDRLPAVDVLPFIDRCDLVKIDIEGAEWPILADPRFAGTSARAIVLEYHPSEGLDEEPRAVAVHYLEAAGFSVAEVWSRPDGHGVVWGWKPS